MGPQVWGHRHVTPGVLTRAIAQLRHVLEDDPHHPLYIQTQHGLGYRFIGELKSWPQDEGPPARAAVAAAAESDGGDGFTPLALAAAWEPRLRLGTAIIPAFTRAPALMAQSTAALADAAPGRFALGLGTSSDVIVQRWNGVPFERPYYRVRDMVRFLRDAFSGEKVTKEYDTFSVSGFRLGLRPEGPRRVALDRFAARPDTAQAHEGADEHEHRGADPDDRGHHPFQSAHAASLGISIRPGQGASRERAGRRPGIRRGRLAAASVAPSLVACACC